ncbi:SIMPL domain-containing protein [Tepidimonas sp.]|uniref:SIMPL domain-containing protein n=1 Tax=Tepidimonas sp. TaxID=2002775 RepID=UPI0039191453
MPYDRITPPTPASRAVLSHRRLRGSLLARAVVCTLFLAALPSSWAQGGPEANVVHLSAQAEQRLPQDWITITVAVRHQAPDAAAVQAHLGRVLEQALAHIRPRERAGRLEVASGGVQVQPRYGRDGQITGWQGSAELLLQGRDLAGVAALAAELPGMAVTGLRMSLSREAARQAEAAVRAQAIEAFRQQAAEVARAFGFQGYELREVHVGTQTPGPEPRPLLRAMAANVAEATPALPVEPGQALLQVTVSGAVRLLK